MRASITTVIACLGLAGCDETAVQPPDPANLAMSHAAPNAPRWYWPEQVAKGADLYLAYCAECHGQNAEGTPNWRQPGPDGKYPPPPLNGSAHTWHHPLAMLRQTVRIGGVPVGGSMPAFGDKLNNDEIDAILAWVQSHWSDQIYAFWRVRDAQSTSQLRAAARD